MLCVVSSDMTSYFSCYYGAITVKQNTSVQCMFCACVLCLGGGGGGVGGSICMSLIHHCWATCVTLTGGIVVTDMCSDGTSVAVL